MRINRRITTLAALAVTAAAALSVGTNAFGAGKLTGAGSSLVAPFVDNVWAPDWSKSTSNAVTYGSVGSTAGIAAITGKTVDFGASDAPLTSAQAGTCSGCVEIPWALAATGFSYHISGVSHLNLSGPVIAEIYLGQITTWNDPAIAKLNKGETLPSEKITPVWRNDGSGDTYVFTSYLSKVSPAWASKVGAGTSVSFPVGTGAKGNSGVAAVVGSTEGAIGNNSWFYIRQDGLKAAAVQNAAGNFVYPYEPYLVAAASLLKAVPNLNTLSSSTADTIANGLSLVDPAYSKPKKGAKPTTVQKNEAAAYPLATFTYVITRPDDANISLVQQFITFALSSAEQKKGVGGSLQFAPLPGAIAKADSAAVAKL
ncbi:MAG TPA: phosphate ABC transporter substrate-binding protein PstS [Solirubrobacteraceae bacterium]|nr:phosphate ABC transporter substrate-binding protein PstS [Solirubrobacteraceae bacterium]